MNMIKPNNGFVNEFTSPHSFLHFVYLPNDKLVHFRLTDNLDPNICQALEK